MGLNIGKGISITGAWNIEFEYPILENTVIPVVTGNAYNGNTLYTDNGTWTSIPVDVTYTYQWQRGTSNISGATSNSYVITNSDIGYTLRSSVIATNAVQSNIAYSSNTAIVLPGTPNAPSNVFCYTNNSTSMRVTWNTPTSDGGGAITSYTVIATSLNGKPTVTQSAPAGSTSYIVTGLVTGGLYEFSVAAVNAGGTGTAGISANSDYCVPAIMEYYQGGYVIFAGTASSVVVAPASGTVGTNTYANCVTALSSYTSDGYGGWNIPSRDYMITINNYRNQIGGYTAGEYWTTTPVAGPPGNVYTVTMPGGVISVRSTSGGFSAYARGVRSAFYP